ESPDNRSRDGRSPTPRSVSPRGRPDASRSPSPRNSNGDVSNVMSMNELFFMKYPVTP
ncbi:serine/arginine-rich splicing factor 2-like, partial [Trifolium medium]|nr:serine/arginine-rich splicing factor 2-like [Trifolium medium]